MLDLINTHVILSTLWVHLVSCMPCLTYCQQKKQTLTTKLLSNSSTSTGPLARSRAVSCRYLEEYDLILTDLLAEVTVNYITNDDRFVNSKLSLMLPTDSNRTGSK
jgi:hypothetical protein